MMYCAEPIRYSTMIRFACKFGKAGLRYSALTSCYGLAECTVFSNAIEYMKTPTSLKLASRASEQAGRLISPEKNCSDAKTLVSCGVVHDDSVLIVEPKNLKLLGAGQFGEVWLKQRGHIARGYWRKEKLTREIFQAKLKGLAENGEPYLRTGDLGFISRGHLYILGRLKELIIINGRNYYPQDIETTIQETSEVIQRDAIAAFGIEKENEERLNIVAELIRQHQHYNLAEVSALVRERVMDEHGLGIDSIIFIRMASLPKTTSGKIQRKKCRELLLNGGFETLYEDRQGSTEFDLSALSFDRDRLEGLSVSRRTVKIFASLCRLLSKVCQNSHFIREGVNKDFFMKQPLNRLGLASIQAAELIGMIQSSLHLEISFTDLYTSMSVWQFSQFLAESFGERQVDAAVSLKKAKKQEIYPTSYGQHSLWLAHQTKGIDTSLNLFLALNLQGDIPLKRIKQACHGLLRKHEVLRTNYFIQGAQTFQRVSPEDEASSFFCSIKRLRENGQESNQRETLNLFSRLAHTPFDLGKDALIRFYIFPISKKERVVLFVVHHIVMDLWSSVILLKDFFRFLGYPPVRHEKFSNSEKLNYFDYSVWQRDIFSQSKLEGLQKYWLNELKGELPVLEMTTKRKIKPTSKGEIYFFDLGAGLSKKINQFIEKQGIGLFTFLLSVWQMLLHKYSQQSKILVGCPSSGRQNGSLQKIIGYFVNPLVFSVDFETWQGRSFQEFLVGNQKKILEILDHSEYPFSVLLENLEYQRDPANSPIFQTFFSLQMAQEEVLDDLNSLLLGSFQKEFQPLSRLNGYAGLYPDKTHTYSAKIRSVCPGSFLHTRGGQSDQSLSAI